MKDYRNHLKLLPHKWQVVCLPLAIALFVALFILPRIVPDPQSLNQTGELLSIPLGVLLMACCLSEEKIEDEYIASVRYRALAISIFIFLIANAITGGFYGSSRILFALNVRMTDIVAVTSRLTGTTVFRIAYQIFGIFASVCTMQLFYIILLKTMAILGSGNNYKSFLFPYRCKKIGWWGLLLSTVLIVALYTVLITATELKNRQILETALVGSMLLPYVAIIMICLSKEEQEDEFIRQIRIRYLAYFAIYYMIAAFISAHFRFINDSYMTTSGYVTNIVLSLISWLPAVAIVFSIVFKRVLSNNQKETCNEK